MNTCPLCKSRVLYQGLVHIECEGRNCPNYKPRTKTIEDWAAEFDDTLIDWTWFMGFVEWLGEKSGRKLIPAATHDAFHVVESGGATRFGISNKRYRNEIPSRLRECVEHAPWLSEILP